MVTAIYSVMHFFVDFLCAWAMFACFQTGAYQNFLIYNFCAFALQMPLGTLLDVLRSRSDGRLRQKLGLIWAGAGVLLTGLGALTHPAVLGIGNALFHVGGGLDVICEDMSRGREGKNLGIFVAPGAVGLYLGTRLGKVGSGMLTLILPLCILTALCAVLIYLNPGEIPRGKSAKVKNIPLLLLCCFAVVILRSWTGFLATFSWKAEAGFLAVLAVALGKALGGFASARFGAGKTMLVTLLLAAGCFLLGEIPVLGVAALLLFNMSMPVTLYLLAKNMPETPGFAFGLLTFGLFMGFLPVYTGMEVPLPGGVAGAVGSVISAVLMGIAWKAVKQDAVSA